MRCYSGVCLLLSWWSVLYSTAVHQRVVESGLVTSFAYEINFVSRRMN